MSKPAPPAPASAPLPTRRQLDELEALLQRMLELPVRQEQEAALPPTARQEISDRIQRDFAETPIDWDDSVSEAAAIEPVPARFPKAVHPERQSPPDSPLFLVDSPPEVDATRDGEDVSSDGRFFPSTDEAIGEVQETDPFPKTAANQWSSESLQPEPGIFRILLGWAGLVCLVISLAILVLDWYGWTW
jgi:hypothetical protein